MLEGWSTFRAADDKHACQIYPSAALQVMLRRHHRLYGSLISSSFTTVYSSKQRAAYAKPRFLVGMALRRAQMKMGRPMQLMRERKGSAAQLDFSFIALANWN